MKYNPQDKDVLPEGFWDSSKQEQDEYWKSRAKHQDERITGRLKANVSRMSAEQRSWDRMMAEIHQNNVKLSECLHRETRLVIVPESEHDGLALDGDVQERCANPHCDKLLKTRVRVA